MTDDTSEQRDPDAHLEGLPLSRRRVLQLSAMGALAGAAGAGQALDDDGRDGTLFGGKMALSQAFKVAEGERAWYQGPDSAKANVSASTGDRYSATDTQLEYYYDGGWTALGVGTSGNKAPASHFQSLTVGSNDYDIDEDGSGDLVTRDDNGNDVLIWDKSAGQWDFKSQDIANIASLDTGEINTTKRPSDWSELVEDVNEVTTSQTNSDQGGAKIVLPGGTLTADPSDLPLDLSSKQGIVIEGQGRKATEIDMTGIGKRLFEADRSGSASLKDNIVFRDFMVQGDKTAGSAGIYLNNVHTWTLNGVYIANLENGVRADASWNGTLIECIIQKNGNDGLRTSQGVDGSTNVLTIVGGYYKGNGRYGMFLQNLSGIFLYGPGIEDNSEDGLHLDNINGGKVSAYFESNGSGLTRPIEIGVAPDPSSDTKVEGLTITGSYFKPSDTAIKLGLARGVDITGNKFFGTGSETAIELDTSMREVTVGRSNRYDSMASGIVGANDGDRLNDPEDLNGGIWRSDVFLSYGELESLSGGFLSLANEGDGNLTVIITNDISGSDKVVDGSNFPRGTLIKGVGNDAVTVTATSNGTGAIFLDRPEQAVENLRADASGLANSAGISLQGHECRAVDCHILGAGNSGGVETAGGASDRCVIQSCIFDSGSISDNDIRIAGNDMKVIGCEYESLSPSNGGEVIDGTCLDSADLGGADGSVTIAEHGPIRYKIQVDAGGSNTNLQGIDGPTYDGATVVIVHTGGENVVLEDDNGTASNPLKNTSGGNDTLDGNGEMAEYVYDSQNSVWRQTGLNQQ